MMITAFSLIMTSTITFFLLFIFNSISMKAMLNREKISPFECGFDSLSKARLPFSTRFFLLAVLFLIFDIEIMILLPIPILVMSFNLISFSMSYILFILIVTLGLFHEWNEGSLNWSN